MTQVTVVPSLIGGVLIGVAAVLLMATTGRIAGVSGFLSRLAPPYTYGGMPVRLAFLIGLVTAPPLYILATKSEIALAVTANIPVLVTAGSLVGFGTVHGNGCTSGHGVCGLARLSPRSLAATAVFMTAAIATVFVVRHVVGGA